MSCQQNQQQCQPPPKCPSPKCPPKTPAQCLPKASSGCALSSGGCGGGLGSGACGGGLGSEGGCCLSSHGRRRSHRCRRQSSEACDKGSGQQFGGSGGCC